MDFSKCPCSGRSLARLLQPAVMAILARGPTHGYDIVRRLQQMLMFRGQPPDPTGVYRLLHTMQRNGLLRADWDLSETGPAKRRFALTPEGAECLRKWIGTLTRYQTAIADVLHAAAEAASRPAKGRRKKA